MPEIQVGLAPQDFADWRGVHALLVEAFAYMEDRIDPPSSLHRASPETFAESAKKQAVVLAHDGTTLVGCGFGKAQDAERLALAKLAVKASHRRRGILRQIIEVFAGVALDRGLTILSLGTRIELTENHKTYKALGFDIVAEDRHPGFDRTTILMFERAL